MTQFKRPSKEEARERLTNLVERFEPLYPSLASSVSDFSETETRTQYIDEFLSLLGWDLANESGLTNSKAEVVMERNHRADDGTIGRPDYILRLDGSDLVPVEAKKVSVPIAGNVRAARQARSYGWTLSLPVAVLTNFAETVLFDTNSFDNDSDADYAVIPGCVWRFTEYLDNFDVIWDHLSYESVASGRFAELHGTGHVRRGQSEFDATFLGVFREWRQVLAQTIHDQNADLTEAEVGRRVQRILNALLFLRVCEDRNILHYEELLHSAQARRIFAFFREKDKVFNAGIFSALEGISIADDSLLHVIREMYWPNSKFAFGLLKPDVLSHIYEQYLSERVVFDGALISLVQKPEVIHSGGVAITPQEVVDRLVGPALDSQFQEGVWPPTVLDVATGSGIFLLSAFEHLLEVAEAGGTELTLSERATLAKSSLFGVDIDGAAVEVARLSILLAVLDDHDVDVATARAVLPNMDHNIVVGNTVVREDFDELLPHWAHQVDVRAAVAPLDLAKAIGSAYPKDGFNVIASNPPYVRIQVLAQHLLPQLLYFQDPASGYESPKTGSFDLSLVFVERSLELLAPGGMLAFIVPNRFLQNVSAAPIRELLGPRMRRMLNFGEEQVFEGKSTYTSMIYVGDATDEPLSVGVVNDVASWFGDETRVADNQIKRRELGAAPWAITSEVEAALFRQMESAATFRLRDVAEVFVGVQSSADEIFFLRNVRDSADLDLVEFDDIDGGTGTIERALLRPCIKDVKIDLLDGQPEPDRFAIFPYTIEESKAGKRRAVLMGREQLLTEFPLALEYFERHRDALEKRSISPDPKGDYWAYGRSQSLSKMDEEKLVVRVLSTKPCYALDDEGLVIPGGGDGGPYYLIRPLKGDDTEHSISVLQAILSHPAVDLYVTAHGKKYRGSYAVHRKANLVEIPIPPLSESDVAALEEISQESRTLAVRLRNEKDSGVRASLTGRREFLLGRLEVIVSELFGLTDSMREVFLG